MLSVDARPHEQVTVAPTIGVLLVSVTVPVMTPFGAGVGVGGLRVGTVPAGELETDGWAVLLDAHAERKPAHAAVKARRTSVDMPTIPEYVAILAAWHFRRPRAYPGAARPGPADHRLEGYFSRISDQERGD